MFIGKVNIVIPTFQRELQLSITIDSFQRALDGYDIEYYVVNNNSKPLKLNFFNEKVIVIDNKINGPCQARNLAVLLMRESDWVWFADDDLYIYDDQGLRVILNNENADLINFKTYSKISFLHKLKNFISRDFRFSNEKKSNIFRLSGGNLICKFHLAKDIKWDENFIGYSYGEDICFGLEVLKSKKYLTMFDPSCLVYHYGEKRKINFISLRRQLLGSLYIEKKYNVNYLNVFLFIIKSVIFTNKSLYLIYLFIFYYFKDSESIISAYKKFDER